jgi:hypothetical protein
MVSHVRSYVKRCHPGLYARDPEFKELPRALLSDVGCRRAWMDRWIAGTSPAMTPCGEKENLMWWRQLVTFLTGGALGMGFGVALGFFLFPFVFPPPPAADQLTDADRRNSILAAGTFIHANPSDPIHWGKGSVAVRQDSVFLGSDFEVGPGPVPSTWRKAPIRTSGVSPASAVRRLGPVARLPRAPALRHSRRSRLGKIPERHHLVRVILGADLARRSCTEAVILFP